MYHVELRQFPHNFCRFNLSEQELRETILDAWAQGEWIELGERKWSPHQANLTVLEGPRLPVEQLSMGRGWRNARRQGCDVTEQLLERARSVSGPSPQRHLPVAGASPGPLGRLYAHIAGEAAPDAGHGRDSGFDVRLAADSIGLEVLAQLGEEPMKLTRVWEIARERYDKRSPSDCLLLAEYAVRGIVEAGLAVVLATDEQGRLEPCGSDQRVEEILLAIDSWASFIDSGASLGKV